MIIEINKTSTGTQLININLKTFVRVRKLEEKMVFTILTENVLRDISVIFKTKKDLSNEYDIVVKKILDIKEEKDF